MTGRRFTVLAVFAAVLMSSSAIAATGGPDSYGYYWNDGETNEWTDISSGNMGPDGDDVLMGPVSLGFTFQFYGDNFSQVYISTNGVISFDGAEYHTVDCTANNADNIAGFFTDIDTSSNGDIYYTTQGSSPNRRFIVQYSGVGTYDDDSDTATFQVILEETSNDVVVYVQERFSSAGTDINIRESSGGYYLSSACGAPAGSNGYAVRFSRDSNPTTTTQQPTTTTTTNPPTTTTTQQPGTTTTTQTPTTTQQPTTTTTIPQDECGEVVTDFVDQCPGIVNPGDFYYSVCVQYHDPECLQWCMDNNSDCNDIYDCYINENCFETDDDADDDVDDDADDDGDDADDDGDDDWAHDDDTWHNDDDSDDDTSDDDTSDDDTAEDDETSGDSNNGNCCG